MKRKPPGKNGTNKHLEHGSISIVVLNMYKVVFTAMSQLIQSDKCRAKTNKLS